MIRGLIAVAVGCLVMFLSTAIVTVLLGALAPEWVAPLGTAPTSFAIVYVVYGFAFAVVGGVVAARLAPSPRRRWVMTMAVVAVLLSLAWSAVSLDVTHPTWYAWVVPFTVLVGIATGGMWAVRRVEPDHSPDRGA